MFHFFFLIFFFFLMRAIRGWRCDRIQEKWYIYNFLLHRGNSGMTTGTEDTVQITSGTLRAPSTFLWRPVYRSVVSLTRGNTRRGKKNLRSISTSIIPISGINTHTQQRTLNFTTKKYILRASRRENAVSFLSHGWYSNRYGPRMARAESRLPYLGVDGGQVSTSLLLGGVWQKSTRHNSGWTRAKRTVLYFFLFPFLFSPRFWSLWGLTPIARVRGLDGEKKRKWSRTLPT